MRALRTITAVAVAAALALGTAAVSAPADAASPTGHKHLTAVEAPGGRIAVKWGATTGVKSYRVVVAGSPDMKATPKTYTISKKKTSATVAPAKYAGANSGNYSFVRVYAIKKNGKVGESPYVKVRLSGADAQPPAGDASVAVATFNIRTGEATSGPSWESRRDAVAAQIASSGAAVVAIQEAGYKIGACRVVVTAFPGGKTKAKDCFWQFEDLEARLGGQYRLVSSTEYASGAGALGKESTRILYDPTRVTLGDQGFFAPSKVDKNLQYVPWAHFTDVASGKPFTFVAVHLANNAAGKKEAAWSKLRAQQAKKVIAFAKSQLGYGQVIVAGDMNSNMYTLPANLVDQEFVRAGAFDAYATHDNQNEFYATFNEFKAPKASASRTDYIFTFGVKGSYSYKNWITRAKLSDHFMQSAILPI
ncbi:hypothetical protein QT381_04740 [Galbitalea sp. SE-J8]|uniref:hypothetical protein n=1 Tax=Galbitalea sp. SE-J8 TaxID=3054952 RepID=UPI00259CE706|nr:hypothetical protein [Galbitalea sp. SE-J8]MDM4762311.1 hypothetical protein [Galbitalea sp. SE-J8]